MKVKPAILANLGVMTLILFSLHSPDHLDLECVATFTVPFGAGRETFTKKIKVLWEVFA
jgi:hypothetical protein